MATLTPLVVGNTAAPNGQWDSATNGDLGDNSDSTYGYVNNNTTATYVQGWELDNVDADFASMLTLSVQCRYAWSATPSNTTWDSLEVRITKADGTSVLAADSGGSLHEIVATNITTTTPTNSSVVAFGFLDTSASKADWDGAIVEVRIDRTRSKGGGSQQQRVFEIDITGTYTPSGGGGGADPFPYRGGGYYGG